MYKKIPHMLRAYRQTWPWTVCGTVSAWQKDAKTENLIPEEKQKEGE